MFKRGRGRDMKCETPSQEAQGFTLVFSMAPPVCPSRVKTPGVGVGQPSRESESGLGQAS